MPPTEYIRGIISYKYNWFPIEDAPIDVAISVAPVVVVDAHEAFYIRTRMVFIIQISNQRIIWLFP